MICEVSKKVRSLLVDEGSLTRTLMYCLLAGQHAIVELLDDGAITETHRLARATGLELKLLTFDEGEVRFGLPRHLTEVPPNILVITRIADAPQSHMRKLMALLTRWSRTDNRTRPFIAVIMERLDDKPVTRRLRRQANTVFAVRLQSSLIDVTKLRFQHFRDQESEDHAENINIGDLFWGPVNESISREDLLLARERVFNLPVSHELEQYVDALVANSVASSSSLTADSTTKLRTALLGLARAHCFCGAQNIVTRHDIDAVANYVLPATKRAAEARA